MNAQDAMTTNICANRKPRYLSHLATRWLVRAFASLVLLFAGTLDSRAEETAAEADPTAATPDPAIEAILAEPDPAVLLRRVDELYRADSSHATVRMSVVTPNYERTMEMEIWSRGTEDTFIRILSPKKDRGIATLKLGSEMWNYFPKVDKAIKVPPSMMMSSWMGSDFTNDDLVKEASLADDYHIVREDTDTTVVFTLTPKEETVTVWAKIIVVVDRKTLIPVEQSYFNERDEKVRVLSFQDLKDFGGHLLPARMEMTPLTESKAGNKTVIIYDDLELDVEIDDEVFTWRNLKSRFN